MSSARRRKAAANLARLICRHRLCLLPIAMAGTLAVWSIALHGLTRGAVLPGFAAGHARPATADEAVHRPSMTASQPPGASGSAGG